MAFATRAVSCLMMDGMAEVKAERGQIRMEQTRQRIIVDWGTSSFRAYRFAADGSIAARHQAAAGILTIVDKAFEAVLNREIGSWLTAETDVLLSGMITSRNGWIETPYIEVPATLEQLAAGSRVVKTANGMVLRFLPGVCVNAASPDVMRGEEIQVFGSVGQHEGVTVVLPGTHSKWVRVQEGVLRDFKSFMTGEVYAALKAHTILGRLIPGEAAADDTAFTAGVRQALEPGSAGFLSDIFTTRSGVLLERFPPAQIAERLSGIVIGHEIRGGLALGWADSAIRVVGEPELTRRYLLALQTAGFRAEAGPDNAAVEGFRRLDAIRL
jgi:2-dehydro-3-deoxygalactonokinase